MSTTDLPVPEAIRADGDDTEFSLTGRVLLAAMSAGAGAIHLAMIAPHAQDSTLDGVLFALAGWFQIIMAFLLFRRPTRALLGVTIGANLVLLGTWAASRTVGLPWGAHAGEAEDLGSVDLVCALFEGALVVTAGLFAWKPSLGRDLHRVGTAVVAGVPLLAVMALTTVALASEDGVHGHDDGGHDHGELATGADGHTHADGEDHPHPDEIDCTAHDHEADHADMSDEEMAAWAETHAACGEAAGEIPLEDRCDTEFNIASYWHEAEVTGVNAGDGHAHSHDEDTLEHHASGMHEAEAARLVVDLSEMSDEEYEEWVANLNPDTRDPNAPDDTGSGGHMGPQPWVPITDEAQCEQLAQELEVAAEAAMKYPTVAEAKAAGYAMVAPYVPGIASHFMNFGYVDGTFEVDKPEMLLFDGNADNAQVVGLSYYILDPGEEQPTQGFTGENDLYHRHIGLCIKNGVVVGDTSTTAEECEALGGRKSDGSSGWMSHAWVVPGCESPWGMFSAANPVLDRALIDNQGQGEPCSGSTVQDRYDRTWGLPDDAGADESAAGTD